MGSRLPDQVGLEKAIERMPRVKRAMAVYIKTNA
jgi:hypothetical protein